MFLNKSIIDEFAGVSNEFSRFFDEPRLKQYQYPPINVYLNDDSVKVYAELPGLEKDDLEISIANDILSLTGEIKSSQDDSTNVIRNERAYGKFTRTIELPKEVNENQVKAKLENGVLEITLAIREEVKPKQISIEVS